MPYIWLKFEIGDVLNKIQIKNTSLKTDEHVSISRLMNVDKARGVPGS